MRSAETKSEIVELSLTSVLLAILEERFGHINSFFLASTRYQVLELVLPKSHAGQNVISELTGYVSQLEMAWKIFKINADDCLAVCQTLHHILLIPISTREILAEIIKTSESE